MDARRINLVRLATEYGFKIYTGTPDHRFAVVIHQYDDRYDVLLFAELEDALTEPEFHVVVDLETGFPLDPSMARMERTDPLQRVSRGMSDEWLYVLWVDGEFYHAHENHNDLEDLVKAMMFDEDKVQWRIDLYCKAEMFKESKV